MSRVLGNSSATGWGSIPSTGATPGEASPSNNRTFSVIGRDTVFTLCDSTDRAIITADDAKITVSALVSDNLVINCTNNNSTVKLKVRYDVIDKNILRETVTTQSGDPVDKIIFHRVSEP